MQITIPPHTEVPVCSIAIEVGINAYIRTVGGIALPNV